MTLLPKMRTKYGEGIGVELFFSFPELQDDVKTYLDADVAAGASSFSADGTDFLANQYIVIGQAGGEKTEIVQISSANSTTVTLVGTVTFAHNRGDGVRFIPYNQIAPEYSTDAVTYNTISAINIRADASETYLQRVSDPSTYTYRFRFYNSTSANYSAYSSAVAATGFADNTVGAVKKRALNQLGEKITELINDQFLNDSIMEARRVMDQNPAIFRWSFRTKFGAVLGQMISGQWSITTPTDLRDRNTPKNILSLRMGNQNRPIIYQDRVRFNQNYLNVVHTTVKTQAVSGQTTLVLNSTHDLDTSGTVTIANNSVADGLIGVTYTANNKTTNTLSGIPASGTGSINRTVTANTDVWQRGIFGLFTAYTIDSGILYFDTPLKLDYDGQDLKGDYYMAIPTIANDSDQFDEPFYDHYVSYLKWKIKYTKANGKIDRDTDADYKDWQNGVATVIGQEFPGQRINFVPDIEGFLSYNQ